MERLVKLRLITASLSVCTVALSGLTAVQPAQASVRSYRPATAMPLLRVGMAEAFSSLDPTVPGGAFDNIADSLALEQLQVISSDGRLENWLATSVSHPSLMTYIFNLRRGVRFWDGNELTSADVVASLDYDRRDGSHFAGELAPIKSVSADGPFTVSVTLSEPDAAILFTMAQATLTSSRRSSLTSTRAPSAIPRR